MRLSPENQAGLYITAIIHLAVIIILLITGIGYEFKKENSFVLDFTRQEEKEKAEELEQLKLSAAEKLEQMLAEANISAGDLRNIAVNRTLRDDRGTDAKQLYEDAERLERDLRDGSHEPEQDDFAQIQDNSPKQEPDKPKAVYSGPSVLSWSLDGRNASHLPIPAYRCMGAGEVTVIIAVDNRGTVMNAKVDESVSSSDNCLRNYAIRAARLSRFSASTAAPTRQMGSITYAFIAQ